MIYRRVPVKSEYLGWWKIKNPYASRKVQESKENVSLGCCLFKQISNEAESPRRNTITIDIWNINIELMGQVAADLFIFYIILLFIYQTTETVIPNFWPPL